MPKSIMLFERVAYLALLLGLTSDALNWSAVTEAYSQEPITSLLVQVISFGGQALFIWLIARKRKNWARWVWIVVIFSGAAIIVFARIFLPTAPLSLAGTIASYLVFLTSLLSTYFLLTRESGAWFRRPHHGPATADVFD